ncbi:MAG: hypothetical protein ACRD4B_07240, partial [Acidobacteriota bacterium]
GGDDGSFATAWIWIFLQTPHVVYPEAHPALLAARGVGIAAFIALLYLAARTMSAAMGTIRMALITAGAVMLAGGLADIADLIVYTERSMKMDGFALDEAVFQVIAFGWSSNALYAGFWYGLCLGVFIPVAYWIISRAIELTRQFLEVLGGHKIGKAELGHGTQEPLIEELYKKSVQIATFVSLPILVLTLYGGSDRFTSIRLPGNSFSERPSVFDSLGRNVLFPFKLRPIPPVIERSPGDLLNTPPLLGSVEVRYFMITTWIAPAVGSLGMLLSVWFLIRFIVARFSSVKNTSATAILAIGWGITVLAASVAGLFKAIPLGFAFPDFSFSDFSQYLEISVIEAMRFGALWGWLVGLFFLLAYWRTASKSTSKITRQDTPIAAPLWRL